VWLRDYVNVHSVDGVPIELFGVMVDVTRERDAEASSLEDRENFRRMVELSPDCIGVHVDETYVYVNQAFVQLLGAKSEAEIVGRNVFSFVDPASCESVRGWNNSRRRERANPRNDAGVRTARLDGGCGNSAPWKPRCYR
jgi:PAS domain S-box-containing protein